MTCKDCAAASTDVNWAGYTADCRGCSVRAVATGPVFFGATLTGEITPAYRSVLQSLLGGDLKAAHKEVKAEHDRLQSLKKGG